MRAGPPPGRVLTATASAGNFWFCPRAGMVGPSMFDPSMMGDALDDELIHVGWLACSQVRVLVRFRNEGCAHLQEALFVEIGTGVRWATLWSR